MTTEDLEKLLFGGWKDQEGTNYHFHALDDGGWHGLAKRPGGSWQFRVVRRNGVATFLQLKSGDKSKEYEITKKPFGFELKDEESTLQLKRN